MSRPALRPNETSIILVTLGVVLPMIYVLSIAPVAKVLDTLGVSTKTGKIFYAPVIWLHDETPLREPLEWYMEAWGQRTPCQVAPAKGLRAPRAQSLDDEIVQQPNSHRQVAALRVHQEQRNLLVDRATQQRDQRTGPERRLAHEAGQQGDAQACDGPVVQHREVIGGEAGREANVPRPLRGEQPPRHRAIGGAVGEALVLREVGHAARSAVSFEVRGAGDQTPGGGAHATRDQ